MKAFRALGPGWTTRLARGPRLGQAGAVARAKSPVCGVHPLASPSLRRSGPYCPGPFRGLRALPWWWCIPWRFPIPCPRAQFTWSARPWSPRLRGAPSLRHQPPARLCAMYHTRPHCPAPWSGTAWRSGFRGRDEHSRRFRRLAFVPSPLSGSPPKLRRTAPARCKQPYRAPTADRVRSASEVSTA